tara:strand:- start:646 stop:1305 length:660 start_codon:yes stop_codon:yes gene_type:complete
LNQKLVILTKATILFFALWIGYVLILLAVPDVFNGDTLSKGSLRLAIRLVLWTIPVVYYARATEQQSYWSFIELKTNWKRGFIGGMILLSIVLILNVLQMQITGATYSGLKSISAATWLNPIVGAPFVEEVLFRGMVFKVLDEHISTTKAVLINSALFAGIHLPYWLFSGAMSGFSLLRELTIIFIIGMVLSIAMKKTGSLITPLMGHWTNNLFSIVIR